MKESQGRAPIEDAILVSNVLKGDVDSFQVIVEKYQLNILRFIYGMIKQKEASEDITQEVFITVYNKLDMYNNKYNFINWVLQIAKNKTIDYMRKYRKVYESDIDEAYNISSSEMGPEESLEYLEVKENVNKYIKTLDEVDKQILNLRYSQNLTFRDIGEILDITETTVKRRYYKVRDGFKVFCK
ncbi:RNA polymerase sigma factor [Clostridium sulfidigenes]|uniref:RNA polymerase sigma factor n=1 Tax=Clostridium sulfidigenes TaxID=318464 RepID=UPI00068FFA74|nr:sigma-70 family RNA polymerase sigma factor [Clostridium sulfidigenes]